MDRGTFRFANLGLMAVCLLFLSACANDPNRVGTLANPYRYIVPTPNLVLNEDQGVALEREKVSRIDVVAPKKGQQLVAQGISIRINNGQPNRYAARYFLEKDFEPVVRALLAQRYEIDPASDTSISAELLLIVGSRLTDDWICKSWETKTRIVMNLTESSAQGDSPKKTFRGAGEDTTCPFAGNFTSPETMGETLDDAFQAMTGELLNGKRSSTLGASVVIAESD